MKEQITDNWIDINDIEKPIKQDFKSKNTTIEVLVTDGVNVDMCEYSIGGNHISKQWESFLDYRCDIYETDIIAWQHLPDLGRFAK